jgi:hypothetical protein
VRILLDECLPRSLAAELSSHQVVTVAHTGWSGVKNGELLRRAAGQFDALVTIDRRFADEQAIPKSLVVILIAAKSNRIDDLRPLAPASLRALSGARKGERVHVSGDRAQK